MVKKELTKAEKERLVKQKIKLLKDFCIIADENIKADLMNCESEYQMEKVTHKLIWERI